MTMVFDRSHKEIIGGPVIIEDDEPATKYRAESDGRTFWAYNGMEVFYEDERLYGALDRIEALEAALNDINCIKYYGAGSLRDVKRIAQAALNGKDQ